MINLEGIVMPVLPGPQLDVVAAELSRDADGFADEFKGPGADGGIGVSERAPAELASVDLRRDADGSQAIALEGLGDLAGPQAGRIEGVVDVDDGKIADLAGLLDRLQGGDGRSVSVGRVAVDVLSEVPEAGSVLRLGGHGSSIRSSALPLPGR
jgi:hypothetical protein